SPANATPVRGSTPGPRPAARSPSQYPASGSRKPAFFPPVGLPPPPAPQAAPTAASHPAPSQPALTPKALAAAVQPEPPSPGVGKRARPPSMSLEVGWKVAAAIRTGGAGSDAATKCPANLKRASGAASDRPDH